MNVLVVSLLLALGAACGSGALGVPPPPPPPPPPAPPVPDAPLVLGSGVFRPALETFTLDNGLAVYLLPDPGAPLVCVQVWVKAGSVDEHEGPRGPGSGITGLSHFFEHLMFQGTERFPNYDLALSPLGAKNNAFTYQDATVYWAYTPKEHLRHILDIEADRFRHMKVDFVHLEPEREVVKSERRQNTDADPGELADELATKRTFDRFPYRWGPIGWMEDLDSVPLETAQRYHAEHYTTTGAYLVIAGDFDAAQAKQWVQEMWGPLVRPANAPGFLRKSETLALVEDWVGPRADHLVSPVEQPIALWSYRAPAPGGASMRDYAALELVDHALTAGKAGRLSKRLVYTEQPKVSNLWARLMPLRHPYNYLWRADLLPGVTTVEVERVIDDELASIRAKGLGEDELAQAVASLTADAIRTNLSNSDKAETIGMSIASTGAPFALYERLDAYPTITQDELKAAAAKYLVPERRVRVVVVSLKRLEPLTSLLSFEAQISAADAVARLPQGLERFETTLNLEAQRAELEREARAIALLKQRADVARKTAKSKEEKAAIKAYLDENEMGAKARTERLKEARATLRAAEAELAAARAAAAKLLADELERDPAIAGDPVVIALKMLDAPLSEAIEVPTTARARREGLDGAKELALMTIAAFAYDARGLKASAQEARRWVLENAPGLANLPEPAKTQPREWTVRELARLASSLANDTDRKGIPLADRPRTKATNPEAK